MDLVLAHYSLEQFTLLRADIAELYPELSKEISEFVTPQHALLFAEPQYIKNIIYWHTEGKEVVPWKSLSEVQQKETLQVIRSILVDITSTARLYPRSIIFRALPFYGYFPSLDHIYLVDGRPVITAWGYAGVNGFYNPLSNETLQIIQRTRQVLWSKFPWNTALVALFLGVLSALLWHVLHHSDKVCYATYPLVTEVENALKEQDKNKDLNKKKGDLLNALEVLRRQCKIPPVQPLEPKEIPELEPLPEEPKAPELPLIPETEQLPGQETPKKQDIPQPKPEKKADLPKEAWDKKDVSMLQGCWHLTTPLKLVTRGTDIWTPVKSWRVCFNNSGAGNQVISKADGSSCRGPVTAFFQGTQLVIKHPQNCDGGFLLVKGTQTCTRVNDKEARCLYKDDDMPFGKGATGTFKR